MMELVHVHPPLHQVRAIIQRALDEDIGAGDVTTDNAVPADQKSRAVLLAKQDGVLCGGWVFAETLALVDPAVAVDLLMPDGAAIATGDVVVPLASPFSNSPQLWPIAFVTYARHSTARRRAAAKA